MADVLPKWFVGLLPKSDKILTLRDQVQVEGILLQECLRKVVPSLDGGHVKGCEPLECGPCQTLLEQTYQQTVISLKLDKVAAICLQVGDWVASTIVFIKFQDVEVHWECHLWKVAEVLELVGLAVWPCT